MGGESFQNLLTDEDRHAHLHKLLAHRFKAHEQIQLPSLEHYNILGADEGLQSVGREMCRQLGFKPNGLKIHYGNEPLGSGYQVDYPSKTLLIDPQLKKHPYSSGAELVLAVTAFVLEYFSREAPDRAFIEYATIETGMGLWVVNALRPQLTFKQKIYHLLDTSWFHSEGIQLVAYSPKQYVERFVSFTHGNHITIDAYLPHVLSRVRYLFPDFVLSHSARYLPEAAVTLQHKRSANLLWVKVTLVALIMTSGIVFGVYALNNEPTPVNPEIARQHKIAAELKKSYADCQDQASRQQSTYDPNDLFMTRQIDNTKTRCESLRNQYNYAVDQYNKLR